MADFNLNYTGDEINNLLKKINDGEVLSNEEKDKLKNIDLSLYVKDTDVIGKIQNEIDKLTIVSDLSLTDNKLQLKDKDGNLIGTEITLPAGNGGGDDNPISDLVIVDNTLKLKKEDGTIIGTGISLQESTGTDVSNSSIDIGELVGTVED